MLEPDVLALTALGLPLVACLLSAALGGMKLGRFAHLPAVLGFAGAAVAAVLLVVHLHDVPKPLVVDLGTWFAAGDFKVTATLGLDPLAGVMLATVTFISTWIALFSAGYMHDEPGYARYFALMGLFVFSMCLLVLANNFLLLVAGWEGVGLCSYLLVGYYYAKPSAAAAARKAFLVTRLGDVGFILGIMMLWSASMYQTDMTKVFDYLAANPPATETMTVACLLLFCGAVGKSAQLPLYVWLPDAMEGPTPVSALIHAATMVTAGVYLLARCASLFVMSPTAQIVVCVIGGLTALLAAFIALTQTDLKRVLAYSTVSQLGFMFLALGTGGPVDPSIAVAAAIFHLFTHAFFKALLFLGSGSVMHAMGGVIDMRKFGGLRKILPVTHLTFLCGAAALAGLPLLSGFWSKDQILDCLSDAAGHTGRYRVLYQMMFATALLTAALTAFYTFRAYFLTFWGPEVVPAEAGDHAHESPRGMTIPLVVLAIGAVFAGAAVGPFNHAFSHFIEETKSVQQANTVSRRVNVLEASAGHKFSWSLAGLSALLAIGGAATAGVMYARSRPGEVPDPVRPLYSLSRNKGYVDEVYATVFVAPAELLSNASRQFDGVLDSIARLVAFLPRVGAAVIRPIQNGLVQFYALGTVLGLVAFVSFIVYRAAR